MLIVHHLGKSQSERIVWLCEELGIPYELKRYERDPVTILAPPEYRALHPIGAAPVITDGDVVLAESGAIIEYIIAKHGGGRLALGPNHPDFAAYLYWFHFANGTLQPVMGRKSLLRRAGTPEDHPAALFVQERLGRALGLVEARLGEAEHFAGREFTAADIMAVFTLDDHALLRARGPRAVPQHPRLPATHQPPATHTGGPWRRAIRACLCS